MELTREQELIVNDNESSTILVSASAGTGKTTLMIEKIMRLIQDKSQNITLDDIVFIAFNKSVAQEIKVKIANAISETILSTNVDQETVQKLRIEMDKIYNGNFETIDAYALKTLKSFSSVSEHITSDLSIVDNMDEWIKKEIANIFRKEFYIQYPQKYKNIKSTLKWYNADYTKIIFEIMQLSAKQYDPDGWILDLKSNKKEKLIQEYIVLVVNIVLGNMKILSIKDSKIEDLYIRVKNQLSLMNTTNYDLILKNVISAIQYSVECEEINKKCLDRMAFIKKELEELQITLENIINTTYGNCEYINDIVDATIFCTESVRLKKIEKQEFEFSDVTYFCNKMFESNDLIREEVQSKIKYLIIDEAQDLSRVQHHFINLIGDKAHKIYIGDEKQSIYAFRDADPKYFLKIKENLQNGVLPGKVYSITRNFRSKSKILENVNEQMSVQMQKELSDIDYFKEGKFSVIPDDGRGEIVLASFARERSTNDKAIKFAKYIVKDLVNKYGDVKSIDFDKHKIAIIAETNDFLKFVADELSRNGVAIQAESCGGKIQDVFHDVYMLLKMFLLPYDNMSFLYFLVNEYFVFDSQEILTIAKKIKDNEKSNDRKTFFSVLINNADNLPYGMQKFREVYLNILSTIRSSTAINFMASILGMVKEFEVFLNNSQTWKLINSLETVLDYVIENRILTVVDLFKVFNNNLEIERQIDSNSKGIQLYTIHKSKGLEWDSVYLILKNQLKYEWPDNYIISNDYGIMFREKAQNEDDILFDVLKSLDEDSQIKENYRKLYVALTRAKNDIHILFDTKKPYEIKQNYLYPRNVHSLVEEYSELFAEEIVQETNFSKEPTNATLEKESIKVFSGKKLFNSDEYQKLGELSETTLKYRYTVTGLNKELIRTTLEINNGENYEREDSIVGLIYHSIFENIDFEILSEREIKSFVETILSKYSRQTDEEIVEKVIQAIQGDLGLYVRSAKKIYRELDFSLFESANKILENNTETNKIILRGQIDLLLVDCLGENIIIDYKLSNKSDKTLKETYKNQLLLYKKAIEDTGKYTIDKLFIYNILQGRLISIE